MACGSVEPKLLSVPIHAVTPGQLARTYLAGCDTEHPGHRGRIRWQTIELGREPPADRSTGEGDGCRVQGAGIGRIDRVRQFVEQIGFVTQQCGLAGEHWYEVTS